MSFTFVPNTNQDGSSNVVIQGTSTTLNNLTIGDYTMPSTAGSTGQVLTVINDATNPKTMGYTNVTTGVGAQAGSIILGSSNDTLNLTAPGGITINSGIEFQYDEISSPTTLLLTDAHYFVNVVGTNSTTTTITLPEATAKSGKMFIVSKSITGGAVNIVADTSGTPDTIDGDATYSLTNTNERVKLLSNGNNRWLVI